MTSLKSSVTTLLECYALMFLTTFENVPRMFEDNVLKNLFSWNCSQLDVFVMFPECMRITFSKNIPKMFCDNLLKMLERYSLMFLKTFTAGTFLLSSQNVRGWCSLKTFQEWFVITSLKCSVTTLLECYDLMFWKHSSRNVFITVPECLGITFSKNFPKMFCDNLLKMFSDNIAWTLCPNVLNNVLSWMF